MVLILLFLVVFFSLLVILYFYLRNKDKSSIEEPINTSSSKSSLCVENDISNYNFTDIPFKGSQLMQNIKYKITTIVSRIKEGFALTAGTVSNKSLLVPTILYNKGVLIQGTTSQLTPSLNGGNSCTPYPTEIYIPVKDCPFEETRDSKGNCQCPTDKIRDTNGVCQWIPCPGNLIRLIDGLCAPPCPRGFLRDPINRMRCNPAPPGFQTRGFM